MTAYCFFDIREITDPVKMTEYGEGVFATVEKYGGRFLVRGGKCDGVEGRWRPSFAVIIEFPSLDHAHRWYDSPEYAPLLRLRLEASRGDAVFIEGH